MSLVRLSLGVDDATMQCYYVLWVGDKKHIVSDSQAIGRNFRKNLYDIPWNSLDVYTIIAERSRDF